MASPAFVLFFGTEQETEKHIVVDSARFHFMDSMRLWFNSSGEPQSTDAGTTDNTVTLSEAFYHEITAHPIPVEREVIAALAHAPGLLDFYVWIAWKSWTANGQPTRIPILGANGLSHQHDESCRKWLWRALRIPNDECVCWGSRLPNEGEDVPGQFLPGVRNPVSRRQKPSELPRVAARDREPLF